MTNHVVRSLAMRIFSHLPFHKSFFWDDDRVIDLPAELYKQKKKT